METREQKVRQLVADRDDTQAVRIVSTLRGRLRKKTAVLRNQADVDTNLRRAFMEAELDRVRLQRMSKELYLRCESRGFLREADEIASRYGGIAGPGGAKILG